MKKIIPILLILLLLAVAGWFLGGKAFFMKRTQGQMMQKMQTVQRTLDQNSDGIIDAEEIKMDFQLAGPGNLFRVYKYENAYGGVVALAGSK